VASALPVQHAVRPGPAEYIRYTPATQGDQYAAGAQQRIIRMVEEQRDPMEPPRFQLRPYFTFSHSQTYLCRINTKLPRPPPSPPAPVMHSPPRKLTTKDQADWKIPPCMSNWKNPKGSFVLHLIRAMFFSGYTIALDKRLAADGRGLQQV
jgi:SNW domain-containing protein 1